MENVNHIQHPCDIVCDNLVHLQIEPMVDSQVHNEPSYCCVRDDLAVVALDAKNMFSICVSLGTSAPNFTSVFFVLALV